MTEHMERAVQIAREFHPHPNPRVGAVIVDGSGRVVGEGSHRQIGGPHAEVQALKAAGYLEAGCTMYVTLEPCNHQGRTGPCTAAISEAGISKVVIGALDPDMSVSGRGVQELRRRGIEVEIGDSAPGLADLDPGYFHHRRTGRPRFTLKSATTLDGQVAAADGSSKWITGEAARLDGHRQRAEADAVLAGAGTVISDDPGLDVRLDGYSGRQPRPVIVAGRRRLPADAQLFTRDPLVVTTSGVDQPGELLVVEEGENGRPDPAATAAALGERGIVDVLIEGGPGIAAAWWKAGLIDRGIWYIGARLAGGKGYNAFGGTFRTLADSRLIKILDISKLDADLRVEFIMEE